MQITQDIIKGLMVLLPGFVTAGVIRALFVGETENDFDKVVRSLIYSFIDYTLYTLLVWIIHKSDASPPRSIMQNEESDCYGRRSNQN
jgi:hypothetical protein